MRQRAWTPDQVIVNAGNRILAQEPKRDCNRCGTRLGDMNEIELAAAARGRRISPVNSECPMCLGFHAILATYVRPLEAGIVVPLDIRILCPGAPAGAVVANCAAWAPCGCVPAAGTGVPSVEWASFLASPCASSPTGEHRHLVERDEPDSPCIAAPQADTCEYLDVARRSPGWQSRWNIAPAEPTGWLFDVVTEPGLYPVEIELLDRDTLAFEFVKVTPHRHAEVGQ